MPPKDTSTRKVTHTPALGAIRLGGDRGGGYTSQTVQHYGCTFAYVLEGAVELDIGQTARAEPGSIFLVPTGMPHRGTAAWSKRAPRPQLQAWGVSFCPSCLELNDTPWMTPFQAVRWGASPIVEIPSERQPRVEAMFVGLHEELQRAAPESAALGEAWLKLLLGELRRYGPQAQVSATSDSLHARALAFIEAHALERISLRDVAQAVHCAPNHLATTIKQHTGQTVGDWITAIRVSSAANWLLHSDASLEDIAERVGWSDRTHFTRQFRKVYGQTPAAWRARMRNT